MEVAVQEEDILGSAEPVPSLDYGGFNPATGRPESAPLPR
jgi:hypothetical protein